MKNRYLFFILYCIVSGLNAQVVFYEGFTSPFNATANGWNIQNLSQPAGTSNPSWFQGNTAKFSALTGSANDYFASDVNSTASTGTNNTISSWLITPTLSLTNGAVIEFATCGSNLPTNLADRLQVYYSTAGSGTNVGTTAGTATNTAGTFTDIVLDINPTLNTTAYPKTWSIYSATLSGISGTITGRMAFRYYVPNGGAAGVNSNYIGIDEVRYSLPCTFPTITGSSSQSICAGKSTSLTASVILSSGSVSSFSWCAGASTNAPSYSLQGAPTTTPSVFSTSVVTPTLSNVYYFLAETTPGCIRTQVAGPVTIKPLPTLSVTVSPTLICSGKAITLLTTGATTYTYDFPDGFQVDHNPAHILYPVTSTLVVDQFTVTGLGSNGCAGTVTAQITIYPSPTVNVNAPPALICLGESFTLSATGAPSYNWYGSIPTATGNSIVVTPTVSGSQQIALYGTDSNGCKSVNKYIAFDVVDCTGISEHSESAQILVYPNPFTSELHLKNFNGSYKIYNALGELILERAKGQTFVIQTSDWYPGIYFLQIQDDTVTKAFRLVK